MTPKQLFRGISMLIEADIRVRVLENRYLWITSSISEEVFKNSEKILGDCDFSGQR